MLIRPHDAIIPRALSFTFLVKRYEPSRPQTIATKMPIKSFVPVTSWPKTMKTINIKTATAIDPKIKVPTINDMNLNP